MAFWHVFVQNMFKFLLSLCCFFIGDGQKLPYGSYQGNRKSLLWLSKMVATFLSVFVAKDSCFLTKASCETGFVTFRMFSSCMLLWLDKNKRNLVIKSHSIALIPFRKWYDGVRERYKLQ